MLTSVLLAVSLLSGQPVVAGPAGLCHPFEIGAAPSLPWTPGEAWGRIEGYDSEGLLDELLPLLDGSDDLLVHLETLRRAVIYCDAEPEGFSEADHARAAALVEALEARVDAFEERHAADPELERDVAEEVRLEFDHRFARTLASVRGYRMGPVPAADFAELLELAPDDRTLAFGAAVAAWTAGPPEAGWGFLDAALRAPARKDELVLRNALGLARRLFDIRDLAELERRIAREIG